MKHSTLRFNRGHCRNDKLSRLVCNGADGLFINRSANCKGYGKLSIWGGKVVVSDRANHCLQHKES
jgi:hypothetical protein